MPKQRLLRLTIILTLALSALFATYFTLRSPEGPTLSQNLILDIDKDQPAKFQWIALSTPTGPVSEPEPRDHHGPTLILFWASWCYPCWDELNAFDDAKDELAELGLKVVPIGVAMNQGHLDLAQDLWQTHKLSMKMQWDGGEFYQQAYSLDGLPQALLLDSSNQVRRRLIGSPPLEPEELVSFFKELLAPLESDTRRLEKPQQ